MGQWRWKILGCVDDVMMMLCGMYVEEGNWGESRIKYHKAMFTQYTGEIMTKRASSTSF